MSRGQLDVRRLLNGCVPRLCLLGRGQSNGGLERLRVRYERFDLRRTDGHLHRRVQPDALDGYVRADELEHANLQGPRLAAFDRQTELANLVVLFEKAQDVLRGVALGHGSFPVRCEEEVQAQGPRVVQASDLGHPRGGTLQDHRVESDRGLQVGPAARHDEIHPERRVAGLGHLDDDVIQVQPLVLGQVGPDPNQGRQKERNRHLA